MASIRGSVLPCLAFFFMPCCVASVRDPFSASVHGFCLAAWCKTQNESTSSRSPTAVVCAIASFLVPSGLLPGEVSPKSPAVWSPASATRLQDGAWTAAGGSRSPAAVGGSLGDGGSPERGGTIVRRRRSRTGPGDGRLTVEMSIFF